MSFSKYFKELRKERNLTQNDLAKILKASSSQIRNIESGRTKIPRQEMFYSLIDYIHEDPIDVAYNIFYADEIEDYNHESSEINKLYLTCRWCNYNVLDIAPTFIYKNNQAKTVDGIFWKAGFPYYRVLLGNFNKERYLDALDSQDKLKEVIFSETLFVEDLKDCEYVKEIRFVLDKHDPEQRNIFKELKKISLSNLGKEYEISYLLFDTDTRKYDPESGKHYITGKKSIISI